MNKQLPLLFALIISLSGYSQNIVDQGVVTSEKSGGKINKTFFEVKGIVSMEAENASYIYGWSKADQPFDTKAMKADSNATWKGGVLRFEIGFTTPGMYAIWVLGRKGAHSHYGANDVKVWFDRDLSLGLKPAFENRKDLTEGIIDGFGYHTTPDPENNPEKRESELNFRQNSSFVWLSNPKDGQGPAFWNVKTPGKHHIEFVMGEEYGYAIDKVVLSLNNEYKAEGRGPKETDNQEVQPFALDEVVLPPQWAFGILYGGYTNQEETIERVNSIIKHDYPIDGYWIDSWFWDFTGSGRGPRGYLNFTGDTKAFPDTKSMWDELAKSNVKAGIWIWDVILKDGNENVFNDFLNKNAFSEVFTNKIAWHNFGATSECGQINFSDSASVEYFQSRLKPMFDNGLDFLKLDRGPQVPFAKGVFEAIQKFGNESQGRAFIIQHVGDLNDPAHKKYPTKWSGDSEMAWSAPGYPDLTNYTKGGLSENIEMVANPRKYDYDVPFLTNDGGGFKIIGSKDFGEELFIRWIQFSLFSPVTEVFQSLFNSNSNLAWKYSPKADSVYKELSHLRMQLFPYIYTYAHLTRLYGDRICKGDGEHPYQYLFGNELLVGPVNEKGAMKKKLYFPEGEWINYWTGIHIKGNQEIEIDSPLEHIPLFIRSGSIIPYRDYARSIQLGNNNHLTLEIYPEGSTSFEMIEDDGESNDYLNGLFAKTKFISDLQKNKLDFTIKKAEGSYKTFPAERDFTLKIHLQKAPEKVSADNRNFKKGTISTLKNIQWVYLEKDHLLIIKLNALTSKDCLVSVEL